MKIKYSGIGFVALEPDDDPRGEPYRCAPVLQRMVEIMGAKGNERGVSFGAALERAQRETGITVPPEMEQHLLTTTFQIISSGRIPGAPDA